MYLPQFTAETYERFPLNNAYTPETSMCNFTDEQKQQYVDYVEEWRKKGEECMLDPNTVYLKQGFRDNI